MPKKVPPKRNIEKPLQTKSIRKNAKNKNLK